MLLGAARVRRGRVGGIARCRYADWEPPAATLTADASRPARSASLVTAAANRGFGTLSLSAWLGPALAVRGSSAARPAQIDASPFSVALLSVAHDGLSRHTVARQSPRSGSPNARVRVRRRLPALRAAARFHAGTSPSLLGPAVVVRALASSRTGSPGTANRQPPGSLLDPLPRRSHLHNTSLMPTAALSFWVLPRSGVDASAA